MGTHQEGLFVGDLFVSPHPPWISIFPLIPRSAPFARVSRGEGRAAKNERIEMTEGAYLYIVRCADGSLYVGTTRATLEVRIAQHNAGILGGYTKPRRPVELIFSQWFDRITDTIENERRLKKWSRAKKEALIRGYFASLQQLARRRSPHPSRRPPAAGSSG